MTKPTKPKTTLAQPSLVAHDRFIQSRNIKEAQQYLWEASLSHNSEDIVQLKMAIWHLQCEQANREAIQREKRASQLNKPLTAEGEKSLMIDLVATTTHKLLG